MSDLLDAPAGKHGWLTIQESDFAFEDGTPLKVWGVNHSNKGCGPDREEADRRARWYAKMGVNAIRMHKFAYSHSAYGNPENSTELTKEGWNKLDYYWSRLKEKGYFTVNTPGTKAIAGFTSGQNIDLDDISIQTDNPFTIVYITSLDKGKSIENSYSILVTTIARARNSGMKYTHNNN